MEVTSEGMDLWFLVLLLISLFTLRVDSQLDSDGFISIDCGLAANSNFVDSDTQLTFVSDDQFIDTGVNYDISSQYSNGVRKQFRTVRSFPNGTRNCYTLRSLKVGSKFLIRASFMYGNYDTLNKLPTFDVHLGVNYWDTIELTAADYANYTEIIATANSDYLQVCLINKNLGTPFISVLRLKQLDTGIYKIANSTQSLVLFTGRRNLGGSGRLRYPDDPFDRIWDPYVRATWRNVSTSSKVVLDTDFAIPSRVMQSAVTTLSTNQSLNISWTSDNRSRVFLVILHIAEIGNISSTDLREFNIFATGEPVFNESIIPEKLLDLWAYYTDTGFTKYYVSLQATSRSTLPPLLNAFELYVITPAIGITTNSEDVTAMNSIKANYKVNKDWSGDPCAPLEFSWSGVNCTSDSTKTLRITALNLSSRGLTGGIVSSFGSLSSLKSLDLSYNDLSGDLPTFLDKLSALTYLDITGNNNLSTTLPPGLQSKKHDGNLMFRYGRATPSTVKDTKKKIPVVIIAVVTGVVVMLLIAAVIIIVVCCRRPLPPDPPKPPLVPAPTDLPFSYNDLIKITNRFQNNIGTGGFGSVYLGALENGTQVAVKIRNHSSSQGVKEYLAEAQNLARVHHRYLVSLIGYCMDGDCMALVYEYMKEGNLQDKLKDTARPLSWKQRVQIAYESALGLDYLHKMCNPPLIHRDVKTSNILLNENLEARISDFGLSRVFNNAASSQNTTRLVGTPGYVDPEYSSLNQLSEKSDVFSFGVVLLEIITGKPPIIRNPEGDHLKEWVNQKLSRGDIESIVDPIMNGHYDINSVWKVTDLARRCTDDSSVHRPTMSAVVKELEESLYLEISTERLCPGSANVIEMAYMGGMSAPGPMAR